MNVKKIFKLYDRVVSVRGWKLGEDVNDMWSKVTDVIRGSVQEVLGVLKGIFKDRKEVWWWNEKVYEKKIK